MPPHGLFWGPVSASSKHCRAESASVFVATDIPQTLMKADFQRLPHQPFSWTLLFPVNRFSARPKHLVPGGEKSASVLPIFRIHIFLSLIFNILYKIAICRIPIPRRRAGAGGTDRLAWRHLAPSGRRYRADSGQDEGSVPKRIQNEPKRHTTFGTICIRLSNMMIFQRKTLVWLLQNTS